MNRFNLHINPSARLLVLANTAFLLLSLLILSNTAMAQSTMGAKSMPSQEQFFEGTIDYRIVVTGKGATDFLMNEPAQKMRMQIKAPNYIIHLFEARYPKSFLFIADTNQTYSLDFTNKRAFRKTRYVDTTTVVPIAKATGKTSMVKGITCQEYVIKKPKMHSFFYVCDQYRVDTTLFDSLDNAKANFLVRGLGGRIPLKTVIKQPGLTITTSMDSKKREKLPAQGFLIPEGWVVKGRDNRF